MEKVPAKSPRAVGSGPIRARDVWRDAWSIVRRYPLATILPALVLGSLSEALVLVGESALIDETLSNLAVGFVYYLYLAYAEEVVESARSEAEVSILGWLRGPWQIVSVASRMLVASIVMIGLVVAAIVAAASAAGAASEAGAPDLVTFLLLLLLISLSVLLLFTRLSLFAPALSRERLGPLAALKRSNMLVRGHFWLVFWTATLAFLLEELADEPVALAAELGFGSYGEWIGGVILTTLVMPLAAITTSLAYHHVLFRERRLSTEAHGGQEHVG